MNIRSLTPFLEPLNEMTLCTRVYGELPFWVPVGPPSPIHPLVATPSVEKSSYALVQMGQRSSGYLIDNGLWKFSLPSHCSTLIAHPWEYLFHKIVDNLFWWKSICIVRKESYWNDGFTYNPWVSDYRFCDYNSKYFIGKWSIDYKYLSK